MFKTPRADAKLMPCQFTWVLVFGLILPVSLLAQLPAARLWTVFPPGGKAGTTFTVEVTGTDLDELDRLHFSHPGIAAQRKPDSAINAFQVTVASTVLPGIYDARAIGRFGISNPRAFSIGTLAETTASRTNDSAAAAQQVELDVVINGQARPNSFDYFRISARKGQRILVRCENGEIDSRMDGALVLYDGRGRELHRARHGGMIDFEAEEEGEYLVKVHDFLYRGGGEYFYRLAISTQPYIDFVFPPSGLPATKGDYVLYGRNLPNGQRTMDAVLGERFEHLSQQIVLPDRAVSAPRAVATLPGQAVIDGIDYRVADGKSVSNPALLSYATAPVVAELEPNGMPKVAQKVELPCEYVGRFFPEDDRDWIEFKARKGEVFTIEVFSHRLGLPTDPFLLLQRGTQNDQGEEKITDVQEVYDSDANVGGVEFNTASRDPALRFEVKEEGTYRIQLRDLFSHAQPSSSHVYRLSIRPEAPDFRLIALSQTPVLIKKDAKDVLVKTPFLRRGETMPLKVLAQRRDNFSGEIILSVEGLPSGVNSEPARIEAGKTSGLLFLTAALDAKGWAGPIRVIGKAKLKDAELVREARGGTVVWNVADPANEAVQSRLSAELMLAVSAEEQFPVSIGASSPKTFEAPVGGKIEIPLSIVRHDPGIGALKLKAVGVPALDSLKEIDAEAKATNVTFTIDLSQQKVPEGLHMFYFQTEAKFKYSNNPEGAKLAEEAAKQAEEVATKVAAAEKKAQASLMDLQTRLQGAVTAEKTASDKLESAKRELERADDGPHRVAFASAGQELASASTKLKEISQAKDAAEKEVSEAAGKSKQAEERKTATAARAKEAAQKAQPKEVSLLLFSSPIHLKVIATQAGLPGTVTIKES